MTVTAVSDFTFRTPDGSDPVVDMHHEDLGFVLRLSKCGRRVLVFPPPCHVEIVEGEAVSAEKWATIQAALVELRAVKR